MMGKYNSIIFYFLISLNLSSAQILRVDLNHLDDDSSRFLIGHTDLNYSLDNRSTGINEKLVYSRLSTRTDLMYVADQTAYIFIGSIEYYKSTNTVPFSTGYAHGRVNFLRKNRISYEVYAQLQYDEVRRMRLRELIGGGVRAAVFRKKNVDVHIGTGLMYEHEKWRYTDGDPTSDFNKKMLKSSSYLAFEADLSNQLKLLIWGINQVGYDQESDIWRIRNAFEASLDIKIGKRFTWQNRFSYFYDVRPVIPINPGFFKLTNGLRYQF